MGRTHKKYHNTKNWLTIAQPKQSRSPQNEPPRNIIKIDKNIWENTTETQQNIPQPSTLKKKKKPKRIHVKINQTQNR
jgi:hypothetical protein